MSSGWSTLPTLGAAGSPVVVLGGEPWLRPGDDASAVSDLADGVNRVALPLLATTLTRDPVAVAALTSLAFLPWLLFALRAGVVVDRVDRKRAMAVANAVRALALGGLAATVLTGTASLAVLYVLAGVLWRLLVVHRAEIAGAFDD
jgi:MFS family permease